MRVRNGVERNEAERFIQSSSRALDSLTNHANYGLYYRLKCRLVDWPIGRIRAPVVGWVTFHQGPIETVLTNDQILKRRVVAVITGPRCYW